MTVKDIVKLVLSIIFCQAAGGIGSLFTAPAIPTWYASLKKPAFNPPNWLFSPVWITLFLLMGISLYLVWHKGFQTPGVKFALVVFFIQLALNTLWSILFFGAKTPFFAFLEIILLWCAILLTILLFYKISRPAALLLTPYIAWVSFAAVLNYFLWRLNI